ncbi:MAG TPA: phosphoribosylformylglycinamidine synthase subunit PurS [Rhodothermales bacterium]|nr:phosphoribosylformylglycinamidine synthase [Bacteroidota bacterium]HRK73773.1 phosphoribosylformylglycinamidine synthase subunit PurS [Rhodothermales bacterium]HRR09422.1 phosphoribosylformylglycinamidine synthase subunit PurS [Rhodothermales bacterium]
MTFKALITVTLRPSILDTQGKAAEHALEQLGYQQLSNVRIGKHIELLVEANSALDAELMVRNAAEKLLSNPVMENYTVALQPA